MSKFKILLYYKYVPLSNPEKIRADQLELCKDLNIKGRILISQEGINGTVAGKPTEIDAYMTATQQIAGLEDMDWKISWADEQVFPKLKVRVRDEIVTLGLKRGLKRNGKDVLLSQKADYIEPQELRALYDSGRDFLIIDARNFYEAKVGKFANAIVPPITNFREFPQFVESIKKDKDKEIITYCTGGVRCEKASAYLKEQGFTNVRQLHGGIHEYSTLADGKHFEGEMFVFDKRLHVPINKCNPTIIAKCQFCHTAVTRYIDCAHKSCASLFICCEECEAENQGACSEECKQ
jgi:UPF0176 protein